jgi:predicted DNA-binding ribbon-helix-helix protein
MPVHAAMLTKRTTVLFEAETWQIMSKLAKQEQVSVGMLIREAVIRPVKRRRIQMLVHSENFRGNEK